MFYLAQGKSDTKKPFTEVFVMDGRYMESWIKNLQKCFKNMKFFGKNV